jgi:hypothetical protein
MRRDKAAVSNFERLSADPHQSTIRRYAAAIGAYVRHIVEDFDVIESSDYKTVLETGLDEVLEQWRLYVATNARRSEAPQEDDLWSGEFASSPSVGNVIYLNMHRKGVPARRAEECIACDG